MEYIEIKDKQCDVCLSYYVFKDGDVYISYCPSLDISTSGRTADEAADNFGECLELHLGYCIENDTLSADLLSHGWRISKAGVKPPTFNRLIKKPEVRSLVLSDKIFERRLKPLKFAVQ